MHFKESHSSKEYTDNQCLTLSVDICIKQTEDILKKKSSVHVVIYENKTCVQSAYVVCVFNANEFAVCPSLMTF